MVFLTKVVYEFIFSWCRPRTDLFRGLPLCFGFHGFHADSNVCDGQKSWNYFFRLPFLWEFNSLELFTIPRLDSIIHNFGFSNSKYSLFILFWTLLLSRNSQQRPEHKQNQTKYRKITRKPRSHVRILIYWKWAIFKLYFLPPSLSIAGKKF